MMDRLTKRHSDGSVSAMHFDWSFYEGLNAAVQRCAEAQAETVRMCNHWNIKLRKETEKKGN